MAKLLKGFNDLETKFPEIAKEWHPTKNGTLKPCDITYGSKKKVWWKGSCGHEWEAKTSRRTGKEKRGCPICAGKQVLRGFNDLETKFPQIAKEWHPTKNGTLKPCDVMSGSEKKVWWQCSQGHEWEASLNSRTGTQKPGCPICAEKKVLRGFNDLETKFPQIAKEWHPTKNGTLKPCDVMSGSRKKVWWKGSCGHEWEANLNNRTGTQKSGCPICNESKGEKCIAKYLKEFGILFKPQYKFSKCKNKYSLPFDFAVLGPDNVLLALIEYDGIQHYEPMEQWGGQENLEKIQKNDNIKTEYCKVNNIPLLRIPYTKFEDIEHILETWLKTLEFNENKEEKKTA